MPLQPVRVDPPAPTEAYRPEEGGLRRVFVVLVPTRNPPHDWRVVVDTATGEVLDREDLITYVDGSGLVFDPNPVVTARNAGLRDPDAITSGLWLRRQLPAAARRGEDDPPTAGRHL